MHDDQSNEDGAMPQDIIARELKKLYNSVANEPLPDNILDLLDQLDAAEKNK